MSYETVKVGDRVDGYYRKGEQMKRFSDGEVIGFTEFGGPIVELRGGNGNFRFRVTRVKVTEIRKPASVILAARSLPLWQVGTKDDNLS